MPDSSDPTPKGRARSGLARARALSAEQRSAIAKKGAIARWGEPIHKATHGSADHPLRIGDIEIPCYVLENETRVLSQGGVVGGLGMRSGAVADRLGYFMASKSIAPFVSDDLAALISKPIKFMPPRSPMAFGYPATILADICDAVLASRKAGVLMKQQVHIAERCEILVRGFARVGINALVDEATGYQRDRKRDALAKILEEFVAKELQPYLTTFPAAYYEEMFRLRGLSYKTGSVKRPLYFGKLTNDIVYKRLAPGVLEELQHVTPKLESGRYKDRLFRRLTQNLGYPKLREHLSSVVTIMKLSADWRDFTGKLDRLHPRYDETMALAFDDDDGIGL